MEWVTRQARERGRAVIPPPRAATVGGGGGYGGYGAASGGSPAARGGSLGQHRDRTGWLAAAEAVFRSLRGWSGRRRYYSDRNGNAGGGWQDFGARRGRGWREHAGGGSGGGISLTVGTLSGAGVIAANGGAGNGLGGGGGGGRIAITYTTSAFSGLMSAYGGGGYAWGGAGTIYTKANSKAWGQVLVDNGGQGGNQYKLDFDRHH